MMIKFFLALKICCLFFALSLSCNTLTAQSITGYVYCKKTKDPLAAANIFLEKTTIGAATDINGKYHIENVPMGNYILSASYVGYKIKNDTINIRSSDQKLQHNFYLSPPYRYTIKSSAYLKYQKYHQDILKAYRNNPELIKLRVKKYWLKDDNDDYYDFFAEVEIINHSNYTIYLPKRNVHLAEVYEFEIIDKDLQPLRLVRVVCGTGANKAHYKPDDIVAIEAHSKYKPASINITGFDVKQLVNIKHLQFRVKYYFNVNNGLGYFLNPPGEWIEKVEDTHCKLLRLPLESKLYKFKRRPFYKFW